MNAHRGRVVGLLMAVAALITLAAPALARADMVTQWNLYANNALANTATETPPGAGQAPPVTAIHLAMVHGAVYDAVNAIDGGHRPYLVSPQAMPWDSADAAAATAAYLVLVNIVPAQQPTLKALYDSSLLGIPDGPSEDGGVAAGKEAAEAMIAARKTDGRFGPFRFTVGTTPGAWRPTSGVNDPNAWVKNVTPFLVQSSSQFATKGPNAITSRKYAKEFNEVKEIGSATSTTRTADQTLSARYWSEHAPRTWGRITRTLSAQQGTSIVDNARLFAMVYMTTADSLITVWTEKAKWSNWRPVTAIQQADKDGNDRTAVDGNWQPLIATPPYPDHSSGHLAIDSSFVRTLQQFYRTDHLAWTDTNFAGLTRGYSRLSDALDETIEVRIWSGLHFRAADEQSAKLGKQVANWRQQNFFQRVGNDDDDEDEGEDDD
jgi:hypothetical protein